MLEQFSATVEKIYSAAAGTLAWREALLAIEDLTGSAGAVIDLVPKVDGGPRKTLAGSFTEENCADYARDYQPICPRIRHALEHADTQTQFDYQFMTESDMDRDPVYQLVRHARPALLHWECGCSDAQLPRLRIATADAPTGSC